MISKSKKKQKKKKKIKNIAEKGQSERLKIYVDPNKIYVDLKHLSPFFQNGLVYLAEILYVVLVGSWS